MSQFNAQYHHPFESRHNGPSEADVKEMLKVIGASTLDELIDKTVPRLSLIHI